MRNRYDELDLIPSSVEDTTVPPGLKQEMTTFGNFEILFVAGFAYYKYYTDTKWNQIVGFQMSSTAPRYWTCAIPISETNYYRIAASTTLGSNLANARGSIISNNVAGAASGNLPGLLVQDNINQPQFIFLDSTGYPTCRTTQNFSQWKITFTDETNVTVAPNGDQREYVPIGNVMAWVNGILYVASPGGDLILRSVQGRPLDFVINVVNILATTSPFTQIPGGDAYSTAYSVGVGGITCLRGMSNGGVFVAASNACFSVALNTTQNAPTLFGEYTFIRTFLFNANCLSDRSIFDTTGDTRFVDLTGVRSFNSIQQTQNEGRNTVFTATIQGAFQIVDPISEKVTNLIQDPDYVAGILYDNYELYTMQTVFGPAIIVYDTVNSCWSSFDISQTGGKRIKILTKIELAIQALYAVTEDDKVYRLYVGPGQDTAILRTVGVCSNTLWLNTNFKMAHPKIEVQLRKTRAIFNKINSDCVVTFTPYVNNRIGNTVQSKAITFEEANPLSSNATDLNDVNSQVENVLFSTPKCKQGWRVYGLFSWTGGVMTQFSMELTNITPMNPLNSQ